MKTIDTPWSDRVLVLRPSSPLSPPQPHRGGERVAEGRVRGDLAIRFISSAMTENELATASTFKLESRRDEWILSRIAAKQLAMQLGLADDPRAITIERPFLIINGGRSEWRVSLSHSAPYAGAALSRSPIGLDVQFVRELDERSAHLFLSPEETDAMQRCTLPHRILHFWCAKEAAWKQRSVEFTTLRQVPLRLVEELASGLMFDAAETVVADDLIVAVTLPTS